MYSYKKILALYSPGGTIHPRAYLKPSSLYLPLLPRFYVTLPLSPLFGNRVCCSHL